MDGIDGIASITAIVAFAALGFFAFSKSANQDWQFFCFLIIFTIGGYLVKVYAVRLVQRNFSYFFSY